MIEQLSSRQKEILEVLSENWNVSVAEISKNLKVSSVTIRGDLDVLAENGFIVRSRGGATPAINQRILQRQSQSVQEKNRIAKAAAELIQNGDHIMISAGTTTALIGKYLLGKQNIKIVTNSIMFLQYARINPHLDITLVGGEYRPEAEALVGPIALRELEQFHVKIALLGTDGFSIENGLTANLVEMAEVVKKMAAKAEQNVFLADSSKFDRAGFAHIQPITKTSAIITDSNLMQDSKDILEEKGLSITLV
ncbi:MAG: DeoR/GlpR transcriptional regulator [Phycisphaerae bacterium]|nr:DeoR/GlpR transcriptional regulator [Phycisphaerae bacterium]